MISLLNADFFQQYGILIVLFVALAFLMFISFNRRKKEESARQELDAQLKAGSNVKTYGGVYGKIVSISETTDGKIVLLESGEGSKKSYQNVHINAIFGIDDKKPVKYDKDGNAIVEETEEIDLDKLEAERMAQKTKAEAKPKTSAKKPTTKKTATKKSDK